MKKKTALIIGASRGLGFAMVQEYVTRGWAVVATVRQHGGTPLHELAQKSPELVQIELLDITVTEQIAALKSRLHGREFDLLFVSAGVANSREETTADITTDEFAKIMITNTLSPMRIIEALQTNIAADGTIGVMSSGQGSIANAERGDNDIYRASKASLNMLMRCFAARHANEKRSFLLIAPGWIRTDMGGPEARYSMKEAIPRVVDTINAQAGQAGLQYLDQFGKTVRW